MQRPLEVPSNSKNQGFQWNCLENRVNPKTCFGSTPRCRNSLLNVCVLFTALVTIMKFFFGHPVSCMASESLDSIIRGEEGTIIKCVLSPKILLLWVQEFLFTWCFVVDVCLIYKNSIKFKIIDVGLFAFFVCFCGVFSWITVFF